MNNTAPNVTLAATGDLITIVTVCIGANSEWRQMCELMLNNSAVYAGLHGYGLMAWSINVAEPRHVLWSKIPALLYAVREATTSFVWWQDADSLFVSPHRTLRSLLPSGNTSLTISGDYYCYINSGHLMMRRNAWSATFLQRVWDIMPWPRPSAWPEQAAMIYFISGEPQRCRTDARACCGGGKPSPTLDRANVDYRAYGVLHTYQNDYVPGETFVIHFARNVRGVFGSRPALMRAYTANFTEQAKQLEGQRRSQIPKAENTCQQAQGQAWQGPHLLV